MMVNNPIKRFRSNTCKNILHFHNFKLLPFLFIENGKKSPGIINVTLNSFLSFTLVVFMLGVFIHTVQAATLLSIVDGDTWRYFKGTEVPPSKWNHVGFDVSSWLSGPSGFGYGDSNYDTALDDMQGNYVSIYVRREFTVSNPAAVTGMILTVNSDGPFIAYLNGIEVIRSKVKITEELDISGFAHELLPGTNVLCIQGFNDDINSNNFTFSPSFTIVKE